MQKNEEVCIYIEGVSVVGKCKDRVAGLYFFISFRSINHTIHPILTFHIMTHTYDSNEVRGARGGKLAL